MPSLPRLSDSTSPSADISQPRKLLVPQSTTTKALGPGIKPSLLGTTVRQPPPAPQIRLACRAGAPRGCAFRGTGPAGRPHQSQLHGPAPVPAAGHVGPRAGTPG